MVKESELATEAELKETLAAIERERSDKAKKHMADKASAEIMAAFEGKLQTDPNGVVILPSGWHNFPDPPPDAILLALGHVLYPLNARLRNGGTHDRDAFNTELIERLAEAGIMARCLWHHSQIPGVYIPEVEPLGVDDRWTWAIVGHPDYDPDRQVYDAVNDILGLGEGGFIGGSFPSG